MADEERRKRVMKMFDDVHGGIVTSPKVALHNGLLFNTVARLFSEV